MARRKACEKYLLRFLLAFLFVFIGMGIQYVRDSEMREAARASITRDLAIIESMPEPTAAQKTEAKKRAKRITNNYLTERGPGK
jgi:hypothetical protein